MVNYDQKAIPTEKLKFLVYFSFSSNKKILILHKFLIHFKFTKIKIKSL